MNIIIFGPPACGKTLHADAFSAHFGCTTRVDPWEAGAPLPQPDGSVLALISAPPVDVPDGYVAIEFTEACRQVGIDPEKRIRW